MGGKGRQQTIITRLRLGHTRLNGKTHLIFKKNIAQVCVDAEKRMNAKYVESSQIYLYSPNHKIVSKGFTNGQILRASPDISPRGGQGKCKKKKASGWGKKRNLATVLQMWESLIPGMNRLEWSPGMRDTPICKPFSRFPIVILWNPEWATLDTIWCHTMFVGIM